MKCIKRYILLAVLLVLLIGCLAFSVSAEDNSSASVAEEMTYSFILDGVTYSYPCVSGSLWDELCGTAFYIGNNQGTFINSSGYIVLQVITYEGDQFNYRLACPNSNANNCTYVYCSDEVITDAPYLLIKCMTIPEPNPSHDNYSFTLINFQGDIYLYDNFSFSWFKWLSEDGVYGRFSDFDVVLDNTYVSFDADGNINTRDDWHRLVYTRADGSKYFVSSGDYPYGVSFYELEQFAYSRPYPTNAEILANFDHYETVCTLRFQLGVGTEYVFTYPTNICKWKDLAEHPAYNHPELGVCSFEVVDDSLFMNVKRDDGTEVKYSLFKSDDAVFAPDDNVFLSNEATTSLIPLISLCSDGDHDFIEEILSLPSCVTEGYRVLSCSKCGFSLEYSIPPKAHSFTKLVTKYEPYCPKVGYSILQCSGCTATRKVDIPIKHNYVPATCTSHAYCTGCGVSNALALGHDRDWLGNCSRCGSNAVGDFFAGVGNTVVDGWNDLWGGNEDGSGSNQDGSSGAEPEEGGGNDSNFWSNVRNWLSEQGNKIKDALGSGKDEAEKLGDTVLTVVFLFVGALLIPLLWPLIKAIIEGLTFAVQTVVSLCKMAFSSLSSKTKKDKKK